jgi:hypothetical protein
LRVKRKRAGASPEGQGRAFVLARALSRLV